MFVQRDVNQRVHRADGIERVGGKRKFGHISLDEFSRDSSLCQ